MNELDTKIKQALIDVTEDICLNEESSLIQDLAQTFHGQQKLIMVMGLLKMLVSVGLMFYCIYEFFQQDTVMAMIAYASVVIACIVIVSSIYLIFWISLNKNQLDNNIKRLELQVALLVKKVEE